MENHQQPKPYHAVLGGQNQPSKDAAVLGGIEGAKLRLNNENPEVRIKALHQALNYGSSGIDLIIKALEDTDESVRYSAASSLNGIASTNIPAFKKIVSSSLNISVLIKALQDKQELVRYIAAFTLNYIGRSKTTSATPNLIKALQDESPLVRQSAAFALSNTKKTDSSVRALIKALKDSNYQVRNSAAYALNRMGVAERMLRQLDE